jgi:hypothetical protein
MLRSTQLRKRLGLIPGQLVPLKKLPPEAYFRLPARNDGKLHKLIGDREEVCKLGESSSLPIVSLPDDDPAPAPLFVSKETTVFLVAA